MYPLSVCVWCFVTRVAPDGSEGSSYSKIIQLGLFIVHLWFCVSNFGIFFPPEAIALSSTIFLVRACLVGCSTFKNAGIEHGAIVGDEAASRIEKALDERVGDRVCHIPEKCIANEQGFERREG